MKLGKTILGSPYLLGLLVGLYPIAFYVSNNWFMFSPWYGVLIIGTVSLVTCVCLGSYYAILTWLVRKIFHKNQERVVQGVFVVASTLALAYLLRATFLEMMSDHYRWFLIIAAVSAGGLGWFIPWIRISSLNIVLLVLCLFNLGTGLYSIIGAETRRVVGSDGYTSNQAVYEGLAFAKTPNVYYLVADGYPNREALRRIYGVENDRFYQALESEGFVVYHQSFSNYSFTLSSIASSFDMAHHHYEGSVGNFELLNARELITSDRNAVVRIFKNNSYLVHYVHQIEYILTRGCFVDLCLPSVVGKDIIHMLLPSRWRSMHRILDFGRQRSVDEFERRVIEQIDRISADRKRYFVYVHIKPPGHSNKDEQTVEQLASYRQEFGKRIEVANKKVMKFVRRIRTQDPDALIIINADHGGWGLGALGRANDEVFEGVPDDVIALDHLGVQLAIRWPEGRANHNDNIRTNVNLFRYIFAYLSERKDILGTKVPDDGYVVRGTGKEAIVFQAVHDGEVLEHMVELGPVK